MKPYQFRILSAVLICLLLTGCGTEGAEIAAPTEAAPEITAAAEAVPDETADTQSEAAQESLSTLPAVHSFTAQTLDGSTFTQEDLAAADVTIINIWQTTCGPCIMEMPELAGLEQSLPENVKLVTWCLDAQYDTKTASGILEQTGYTGTTLTSADGDLMTLLTHIMYTPTTVFLDSSGNHIAEELIGSPGDVKAAYTEIVNGALQRLGKEELPT